MDRLKEETLTVVMTFEEEVFNQYVGYVVVKAHSEVNRRWHSEESLNSGNWVFKLYQY